MRKPRDYDAELKVLDDRAKQLKARKREQLGELVIATGADTLPIEQLAGALLLAAEATDASVKEAQRTRGAAFFRAKPGSRQGARRDDGSPSTDISSPRPAPTAPARHDTREWQVKRRERTRQLIELGGLIVSVR
ncbi:conjugal transfer protein TraD (plasmid) [Sphingomonas zeae]